VRQSCDWPRRRRCSAVCATLPVHVLDAADEHSARAVAAETVAALSPRDMHMS
jgi:hypothetical protein